MPKPDKPFVEHQRQASPLIKKTVFPLEDLDTQGYSSSGQYVRLKLDHIIRIKRQVNEEQRRKLMSVAKDAEFSKPD